jgi:hypothetical protein
MGTRIVMAEEFAGTGPGAVRESDVVTCVVAADRDREFGELHTVALFGVPMRLRHFADHSRVHLASHQHACRPWPGRPVCLRYLFAAIAGGVGTPHTKTPQEAAALNV